MNNTVFDVAAAPMYLIIFGIPFLIIVVVAILIAITVKLIKRARAQNVKNLETEKSPENRSASGEDE